LLKIDAINHISFCGGIGGCIGKMAARLKDKNIEPWSQFEHNNRLALKLRMPNNVAQYNKGVGYDAQRFCCVVFLSVHFPRISYVVQQIGPPSDGVRPSFFLAAGQNE
jgi:hypothetical protein